MLVERTNGNVLRKTEREKETNRQRENISTKIKKYRKSNITAVTNRQKKDINKEK